jgi:hypothetical protein
VNQTQRTIVLPTEWYHYCEALTGIDTSKPGLYEWQIEGKGSYIGKFTHISRPKNEYGRNLTRILNNKPYRRGKPDGFRRIHRELRDAFNEGRWIKLIILQNAGEDINRLEQALIAERGNLNGTLGFRPSSPLKPGVI